MTLVKERSGRLYSRVGRGIWVDVETTAVVVLESGKEVGLNSDSNEDKWGFIAKGQSGHQWMENY